MSRYVEGDCEFTSIRHLVKALTEMRSCARRGQKFKESDIQVHLNPNEEQLKSALKTEFPELNVDTNGPVNLHGYMGDTRKQKANVVVPRQYVGGAANDLGWALGPDKTTEFISDYDKGYYNEDWQTDLKDQYNQADVDLTCQQNGWTYTKSKNEDGETQFIIEGL